MDQLFEVLRNARNKLRLSQQEVAERLGITQRAYGFYEDGTRTPKPKRLKELALILGIPNEQLSKIYSAQLEQDVTVNSINRTSDSSDEVDFREKYYMLLEQQNEINSKKLLYYSQLHQARLVTIFQQLAKHRSKMEQVDLKTVQEEMNKDLDDNFQDILKRDR